MEQLLCGVEHAGALLEQAHSTRAQGAVHATHPDGVLLAVSIVGASACAYNNLEAIASIRKRVSAVRAKLAEAAQLAVGGARGRFVWVDGPLVNAMEQGNWLLLDNANLCNPSGT